MTRRKKIISSDDIASYFEQARRQLGEDRQLLLKAYEDLRSKITDDRGYAVNGMTLSKFAELLSKQTGQMLDFIKVVYDKEDEPTEASLTDDDREEIYSTIDSERRKKE